MSQLARIFAGCCCAILRTTIQKQEQAQEQAQKCPGWASQVDGLAVCEENAGLSSGGNLSLDLRLCWKPAVGSHPRCSVYASYPVLTCETGNRPGVWWRWRGPQHPCDIACGLRTQFRYLRVLVGAEFDGQLILYSATEAENRRRDFDPAPVVDFAAGPRHRDTPSGRLCDRSGRSLTCFCRKALW